MDTSSQPVASVLILAAGSGTRMKSRRSKLLHEISGHSLLSYAVDAATALEPEKLVVVVGHLRDQVEAHLDEIAPGAIRAVQDEPKGTGHAVACGLRALEGVSGEIVVTMGDVPLLTGATLTNLVASHRAEGNKVTVMTSVVDDATGYGRIIREGEGISSIVEQRDATDDQLRIHEINAGIYVFDADTLRAGLASLTTNNAQGELYLTDVVRYAHDRGLRVGGYLETDTWQTMGVNDRVQLAELGRELNRRIVTRWMRDGVTIIDPATTWIEADVSLAQDVELHPGTTLRGATSIATGAVIGPDTRLTDCEIGEGAQVLRSEATLTVIGANAVVGPFSYMRPGTELSEKGKIGAFVETKNARIGVGSKVPHLTYCGDAVIGEGSNIGAGVIFANYDGTTKSTTTVGDHSFVGSDSVLVAPVHIADGAYVAAGSVVTRDVDAGQLSVGRSQQRNIDGWVERRRPGTATARAAAAVHETGPSQGEE
ncbi:MAG: bifunctional UDP-N-acetylglucosamine diphosphorylase/glucosamine-1-phosphate N-acetyltransferase GlmU [Propionibacteriaceae bacterium]|jgi:bifunctional UDP-N-acetylglucosamine pyrophosphorylase/glucosamine-1-phosphate N-acetyltransferase|nr:bifunctional UDP-N-acetylglucosamine diphosphorylase/glucosamine-1-phosphate N-acetyltransferase GlmU [Propionibacteriaceae bacterium]